MWLLSVQLSTCSCATSSPVCAELCLTRLQTSTGLVCPALTQRTYCTQDQYQGREDHAGTFYLTVALAVSIMRPGNYNNL